MQLWISIGIVLGGLLFGPLSYIAGDFFGGWKQSAIERVKGELAVAQGQRDAAQKDLEIISLAAERARASADALAAKAEDAQKRIDSYEQELASRADPSCNLTDRDVEWLRSRSGAVGPGGQGASSRGAGDP